MNDSERRRLVEDGVVSFEQAEGITGERYRLPEWAGARTVEWLGYFGALALFFTTFVFVFDLLDLGGMSPVGLLGSVNNVPPGIAALIGAAVLLIAGWRLAQDRAGAIGRSAGFTLLLGFALASTATALLLMDLDIGDFTAIVTVIPIVVVAVFVWRTKPSLPTQLALFAMVVQVVTAILILIQVTEPLNLPGLVAMTVLGGTPDVTAGWLPTLIDLAVGLLWIAMGSAGSLRPRNTAFVIGAIYSWLSAVRLFGSGDGWIVVSILLSALFFWLAVSRRSSVLAGIGAFSAVVLVGQAMSLFTDSPGTTTLELWFGIPGAVALVGALLLLMRSGTVPAVDSGVSPGVDPAKTMEAD